MALFNSVKSFIDQLDICGWAVMTDFSGRENASRLMEECREAFENGDFHQAGVGRGAERVIREDIRRDRVMWLQPGELSHEQTHYLDWLETLRLALNQRFFLGLFGFEGHFAIYPVGAFYKPHLDRHAGTQDRIVTVILYLNPDWQPGDGGELRLWTTPGDQDGAFDLIEPRMGTLVMFMAGDHWHEVLPALKTRMSITGWFRQR